MPPTDQPVWLDAAPGGGGHWKVYRGETWIGWVHRFGSGGRPWRAKPADGGPLSEHFARRRDAVEALRRQRHEPYPVSWEEEAQG